MQKAGVTETDLPEGVTANELKQTGTSEVVPPRKKSVSFAQGTKEVLETSPTDQRRTKPPKLSPSAQILRGSVLGVGDANQAFDTAPIVPTNESTEDAALRRDMLDYSMSEMGAIVAQLDIDDSEGSGASDMDIGDDDDYEEFEDEGMSEASDDENQYGLRESSGINAAYRDEMLELEKKLNAHMIRNLGPQPDLALPLAAEGELALDTPTAANGAFDNERREDSSKSKGVRFAEALDIAPTSQATTKPTPFKSSSQGPPPLKDTIVERPLQSSSTTTAPGAARKPSRFKAARSSAPTSSPQQAQAPATSASSTPLASKIIERAPGSSTANRQPTSPNEFAPALVRQQVATEYYNQRNKFIQQQGGFSRKMQEEQDMEDELNGTYENQPAPSGKSSHDIDGGEENTEPPKKVSLFKAARLKRGAT